MSRRVPRAVVGALLLSLLPSAPAHSDAADGVPARTGPADAASDGAEYELRFRCGDDGTGATNALLCPLYILDEEDIMAQPRLVIHPKDPDVVAFNALHGGPGLPFVTGAEPPTPRSRNNQVHQPHTTFRTTSPFEVDAQGQLDWRDQPYYSPLAASEDGEPVPPLCPPLCLSSGANTRQVFGEDNALAIDAKGQMYEASLYAYRDASVQPYRYALSLWKQVQGPQKDREEFTNFKVLRAETDGNRMDSIDVDAVPAADRVVATWRESVNGTPLPDVGGRTLGSWIGVAWSDAKPNALWTVMPKADVVGPCRAISNVVPHGNATYVACVVDAGYAARPDAKAGDIDLWRIVHPEGRAERLDTVPLRGDAPVLAVRQDGHMALAATTVEGGQRVRIDVSYGHLGRDWSAPQDLGGDRFTNQSETILSARVQALAFAQQTGNLFLVYLEQYERAEGVDLFALPQFSKKIASVHEYGDVLDIRDLRIGDPARRASFHPTSQGLGEGAFDDLHDDLFLWRDPKNGTERLFVTFGDYGQVRFAEIVEANNPFVPAGFGAAPPPPAQPVVDPNSLAQTVPGLAYVAGGALAGAMALTLLLSRKKSKVEAPSLGGK